MIHFLFDWCRHFYVLYLHSTCNERTKRKLLRITIDGSLKLSDHKGKERKFPCVFGSKWKFTSISITRLDPFLRFNESKSLPFLYRYVWMKDVVHKEQQTTIVNSYKYHHLRSRLLLKKKRKWKAEEGKTKTFRIFHSNASLCAGCKGNILKLVSTMWGEKHISTFILLSANELR